MSAHLWFGVVWLAFGIGCAFIHDDLGFVLGMVCANVWVATMPTTQVQHSDER